MRVVRVALLACAVVAGLADDAVVLTANNFDELTSEPGSQWMVEFYAPWCGYCKELAPKWDEAARKLRRENIQLGKVDATSWRSLSSRFGIVGFPTVFHINNAESGREVRKVPIGEATETVEDLVQYARRGWQRSPRLPESATGPYGTWSMFKFNTLKYGERVYKLHEPIADFLGVPPVVIAFSFVMFGLTAAAGGLILLAVWMGPRKRREEDEHED